MRILVVEDDKDISTLISFHLRSIGFETDTAMNGREAEEKLSRGGYSLALLDILLPEISGIEVLKYIRSESPSPDMPVIMASALNDETDIIAALELGADDYITKPFSPKILVARIRSVIRRAEHRAVAGAISTEKGISMDPGTRKCTVTLPGNGAFDRRADRLTEKEARSNGLCDKDRMGNRVQVCRRRGVRKTDISR